MNVRLQSSDRLSNSAYHRNGKCWWWARIGQGDSAEFVKLPSVRGDDYLDVTVDVPDGTTTLTIGVGGKSRKPHDAIRETITL